MQRHVLTQAFRRVETLTLVLVVLGLAWRAVRYGEGFPIWGDEGAIAVNFFHAHWMDAFGRLAYGQIAPLGFLWSEIAITRLFGYSEWIVRLIPFLCGTASLLLFWRWAPRLVDRRTALLAVAVLAASFYAVRYCAEVKPYAADMLVAMVLMALAWQTHRWPRRLGWWLALTAGSALSIWLSYTAAFVVAGMGIFLFITLRRQRWAWLWLAVLAVVAGGSFLLMYWVYARPHAQADPWYTSIFWRYAFPPMAKPWLIPWWLLEIHASEMMAYPLGSKNFGSSFTLLMVVIGGVSLCRSGNGKVVLFLLAPLIPALLAAAAQKYPYGYALRTMLFMGPSFCLLMGAGLSACLRRLVPRRLSPDGFRLTAMVIGAIAIVGMVRDVNRPTKDISDPQLRSAMRRVASLTPPGEPWVVLFGKELLYGEEVPPGKANPPRFQFYVLQQARGPVLWSPPAADVQPGTSGRVWVLAYLNQGSSPTRDRLTRYIEQLSERFAPGKAQVFPISGVGDARATEIDLLEFIARPAKAGQATTQR